MFACIQSTAITGLDCIPVLVEVDVSDGLPSFHMVGDLGTQVRESYDRVRTALRSIGLRMPPKRITVNITPADVRKEGTRFDLPVAAAILAALGRIPADALKDIMVIGELRLNGQIQGIRGVFPSVLSAARIGCRACIVPQENNREAQLVKNIPIIAMKNLEQLIHYCNYGELPVCEEKIKNEENGINEEKGEDFSEIYGQEPMKRAAMIAAAGFHNLLLTGPPGTGKSMAAKRIPGIMPQLEESEKLELTGIYSIAGTLGKRQKLIDCRPFRSPHHTISAIAMAGGGRVPKPGEITLAHKGVLFLDEFPEMGGRTLEVLRQPLEEQKIVISRLNTTCVFPADFLLVAAMNPCPCGFYPDLERCSCTPGEIIKYRSKLSRPIMDRLDLCVQVSEIPYEQLQKKNNGELGSALMRKKVEQARKMQRERLRGTGEKEFCFNSRISNGLLEKICVPTPEGERLLKRVYETMHMSARGYYKILRTSRTIADLEQSEHIHADHISEAICYRNTEQMYWRKE